MCRNLTIQAPALLFPSPDFIWCLYFPQSCARGRRYHHHWLTWSCPTSRLACPWMSSCRCSMLCCALPAAGPCRQSTSARDWWWPHTLPASSCGPRRTALLFASHLLAAHFSIASSRSGHWDHRLCPRVADSSWKFLQIWQDLLFAPQGDPSGHQS